MTRAAKRAAFAAKLEPLRHDAEALRIVRALMEALKLGTETKIAAFARLAARHVIALRKAGDEETAARVELAAIDAVEYVRQQARRARA